MPQNIQLNYWIITNYYQYLPCITANKRLILLRICYMKRDIYNALSGWKEEQNRGHLLIGGARQTRKT